MELAARYHDGLVSDNRDVLCRVEAQSLVIADPATHGELDRWNADEVFPCTPAQRIARGRPRQAVWRTPGLSRL